MLYNVSCYLFEKHKSHSITDPVLPPNVFAVYLWHNLIPFYQTLEYLHFGNPVICSQILSRMASLNLFLFDLPLPSSVSARGKVILSLCPQFIFIAMLLTVFIFLRIT